MLDKQLPYAEIWMTRPLNEELPSYPLNQQSVNLTLWRKHWLTLTKLLLPIQKS